MRYHRNATTNINQRLSIQSASSTVTSRELADQLCVSSKTVGKWRGRETTGDLSSRPHTIHYALDDEEQRLVVWLREHGLMLDDIWQGLQTHLPHINRTNTYRTLDRHELGRLPKEETGTGEFAAYSPGFLHVDWFYLPRLEDERRYCIVAIDRATRWLRVGFYEHMDKANSIDFLAKTLRELPFTVYVVLTDNGVCFTNRWYTGSRGGARQTADFTAWCAYLGIEHRLTKVKHPWTNGLAENTVKQIKTNTTKRHELNCYSQAEECIDAYVLYHNYRKRHRALDWQTSYDTVLMWHEKEPAIFKEDPTAALRPNRNNLVKLTSYLLHATFTNRGLKILTT